MSTGCKRKYVIKVDPLSRQGQQGQQGPPGTPGDPTDLLPISSDDVLYNGDTLTEVLDELLYIDLEILSFIASPVVYEHGQVLTSIALAWAYNKAVQSQSISGTNVVSPSLGAGERNKVVTLTNISVDTIINLLADDNTTDIHAAKTASLNLHFTDKIHWGLALIPGAINSAFILGLSNNELRDDGIKQFNITTGTDEYIWFAVPESYAEINFRTNGFEGGLSLEATVSHINASGATKNYRVYRSNNHSLGFTNVESYLI
jgi:hypothetical protein